MADSKRLPAGVIFDMDGVLVDSNPFHLKKWADYLREQGVKFKEEDLPELILGKRNDSIIRLFLDPGISPAASRAIGEELEARFRKEFRAHARPLPGLAAFVRELDDAGVPMAVASSALRVNIEFVVEALDFQKYFRELVSGDDVATPKPNPEIYLLAAKRLGVQPTEAVGFEDSFPGIDAVKAAGMKCVGVASTFPFAEVEARAGFAIRSFEDIHFEDLRRLFHISEK